MQPSAGAGVRQLALRLRRSVLRPALPRSSSRQTHRRLEVLPGHGGLPALRPDRRARSCWRPAALYFGRIGRDASQFRIFVGSTDLIRGNTSGSYRRNECLNANDANTADRLRRARPAGRHPDRRRQRRAPLPDPQSVVRTARRRSRRSRARCSTTSGWPGTRPSTLKWSRPSPATIRSTSGRRSRPSASRCGPTCSASPIAPAGLLVPPGSSSGQRALDVQPRADVLTAA